MILLDINFTTFIPTTLLGLLGLISGYLYFHYKDKNQNKIDTMLALPEQDRIRAIEMSLNELGVTFDTSDLGSNEKIKLIGKLLRAKTYKYIIAAITLVLISMIVGFLLYDNNHSSQASTSPVKKDTVTIQNVHGDVVGGDKVIGYKVVINPK